MAVGHNWEVSAKAVNVFDAWCIDRRWLMVETPNQKDFGKDATVDVTDEEFVVTGQVFGVQIKGGVSYRDGDGYAIPVGNHSRSWMESTLALIGIVWDPEDMLLRWVNLTAALRDDPTITSVKVAGSASLDQENEVGLMLRSISSTYSWGHLPSGLGSTDHRDQADAVWDCFAIGRRSPDGLVALRRCFLALGRGPRIDAVVALAHCTPHPDILWSSRNWLPVDVQRAVAQSMRWSEAEVHELVRLIDPERGCDRGSIGQTIWMLLREDPDAAQKLLNVAAMDALVFPEVASWALAIALVETRLDPAQVWADAIAKTPALLDTPLADYLAHSIRDHGAVYLN